MFEIYKHISNVVSNLAFFPHQIPISTVMATKKKSPTRQREWGVEMTHALPSDKKRAKEDQDLVVLHNGGTFYVPLIPVPQAEAIRAVGQLGNVLSGLHELSTNMLKILPEGILHDVYSKLPPITRRLLAVVKTTNMGSGTCKGRFVEDAPPTRKRKLLVEDSPVHVEPEVEVEAQQHIIPGDTKKTDYTCFCGVKCKSFVTLTKHIEKKHPVGNDWDCSKCDLNVASQSSMWKHFRTKHLNLYLFKCSLCDVASDEKGPIAYHLYTKHNISVPDLIVCDKCNIKVATQSSLRRHYAICRVEGEKPFPCPNCDKKFRSRETLLVHQKSFHPKAGEAAQWYICTLCTTGDEAVKFQQASSLAKHMESFHNIVTPKKKKK